MKAQQQATGDYKRALRNKETPYIAFMLSTVYSCTHNNEND